MESIEARMAARTRRLVGIIIILAVAAGLAWWGTTRESARSTEIDAFVRGVCVDVATDARAPGAFGTTDSLLEREIRDRLKPWFRAGGADLAKIEVTPGDDDRLGGGGLVTHRAQLSLGGQPILTLRLRHVGAADQIMIVGYMEPEP